MTINYVGSFKVDITFDGAFIFHGLNDSYHPLKDAVAYAVSALAEYGFDTAQILDCDTGEVLVEMENDEDDFDDGPAYYDDGNTCGYE